MHFVNEQIAVTQIDKLNGRDNMITNKWMDLFNSFIWPSGRKAFWVRQHLVRSQLKSIRISFTSVMNWYALGSDSYEFKRIFVHRIPVHEVSILYLISRIKLILNFAVTNFITRYSVQRFNSAEYIHVVHIKRFCSHICKCASSVSSWQFRVHENEYMSWYVCVCVVHSQYWDCLLKQCTTTQIMRNDSIVYFKRKQIPNWNHTTFHFRTIVFAFASCVNEATYIAWCGRLYRCQIEIWIVQMRFTHSKVYTLYKYCSKYIYISVYTQQRAVDMIVIFSIKPPFCLSTLTIFTQQQYEFDRLPVWNVAQVSCD